MSKKGILWLLILFGSLVRAETVSWTGMVSDNWNVASNWNPAQVPATNDDVIVSVDSQVTVPDGCAAEAQRLTLSGVGSVLSINNFGSLMVHRDLEQTEGSLLVRVKTASLTVQGDYLATAGLCRVIQDEKDAVVVEGNLMATSGFCFDFNMNGSDSGIGRIVVGGAVSLGGAKLLLRNFVHNDKAVILLIHSLSDQNVAGSFDVPWGATYVLDGQKEYQLMLIDYDGSGVKNDLALVSMNTEFITPTALYEAWQADHPGAGFSEYVLQGISPHDAHLIIAPVESGGLEPVCCMYARRKNADVRGLTYRLEHTSCLVDGAWSALHVDVTSVDSLDDAFDMVTSHIAEEATDVRFVRLQVTLTNSLPKDAVFWSSAVNGNWNESVNWDSGLIPDSNKWVRLDSGVTISVPNGCHAAAGALSIDEGTLYVGNSGEVTVYGNVTVQSGGFVNTRTAPSRVTVKGSFFAAGGAVRIIQGQRDVLWIDGDLVAGREHTFDFNMNKSSGGIGRIVVCGTTRLNGSALELRNFVHNGQATILLIRNPSGNDVIGSFDLPWGTVFDIEGILYELALAEQDGDGIANDVALVRIPAPQQVDSCRYGLYGHGNISTHPTKAELSALAFYKIRQGGLPTPAMKNFVKAVNPSFITAQYLLSCGPMESHGQTAGYIERTDPNAIARSRAGVLEASVGMGETSFKVNPAWADFNFVSSTLGEGVYYNADETDQEMNSISNFVTWVQIGDEVMKVTGWDGETRILTVSRGIWGTEPADHPAGSNVFSPMYSSGAYPGSPYGARYLRYAFNPVDSGLPVQWILDGGVPLMQGSLSAAVAGGNDGLWLDVSEPGWWFNIGVDGSGSGSRMWNVADEEYYSTETFALARNRQFHAIQTEWFSRTGTWPYLIGNSINQKWYWPEGGNQKTYLLSTVEKPRSLDAMCNECYVGGIADAVVTFHNPDFWKENVRMFMDAAQSGLALCPFIVNAGTAGRTVSDMNSEDREHLELYGFASYLLGWEPDNTKTALGVDILTVNDAGRKTVWVNPIFRMDIGVPIQTYNPDGLSQYQVSGHTSYRRTYSKGVIVVNPYSADDLDVPLGGLYRDPDTGMEVTSVSMRPNSGKIFLSD